MARYMYDAVTVSNIPKDATMVAGYCDGRYANIPQLRQRFPHAQIVTITVFGGRTVAEVVDCEKGDATPAQAAEWALWRHKAGAHPTIYCSTSVRSNVLAACRHLGLLLGRDYEIWEAHYDGVAAVPAGDAAKQFLGDYHGYDKSVVAAFWRGVDPPPTAGHWYVVKAGDSIEAICARNHMTMAAMRRLNPKVVWGAPLKVGQKLWVVLGAQK